MRLLLLLIFVIPLVGSATELRPGDVILQPKRCYLCRMIEEHESSSFSHMGIVITTGSNPMVAEALGTVKLLPLQTFLSQGDATRPHKLIRLKEKVQVNWHKAVGPLLGLRYDGEFLWDNFDEQGREMLYCSEFVTKLMNPYLEEKIPTKIMDYTLNREAWWRYFGGHVPDGLPGNSPGDFDRSRLFKTVGTYQDGQWNWR